MDAYFERGVLLVIGEQDGQYRRFLIRFNLDYDRWAVDTLDDVEPTGLECVVLDSGVTVSREPDGSMRLFHRDPKVTQHRIIEAEDGLNIRFLSRGSTLGFVRGREAGTLSMK